MIVRLRGSDEQTTLRRGFRLAGVGMHGGIDCEVTVDAGPADSGIVFETARGGGRALATNVCDTRRGTTLAWGDGSVATVEHLLAALHGMGVDNVRVTVSAAELPILDGSALPWCAAIRSAGVVGLGVGAWRLSLSEPHVVRAGESWIVATPAEGYSVVAVTDFAHPLLGPCAVAWSGVAGTFVDEIAPARTFGFSHEIEALRAAGLALGGSLDNALVVYPDRFSGDLRAPSECTRHKLLDVVGDLSLSGGRLSMAVMAVRPGHRVNTEFAASLCDAPDDGGVAL